MSQHNFSIRKYELTDLKEVLRLYRDTVHNVNKGDYTQAQLEAWAPAKLDEDKWQNTLTKNITYVAIYDSTIVGFADMDTQGYLDHMFVDKNFQGRHLSKKLCMALIKAAKELRLKTLMANVSITAMPVAKRLGFKLIKKQEVQLRGQTFTNFQMKFELK